MKFTDNELLNDYQEIDGLSLSEKKSLAQKYNSESPKAKDLKVAILVELRNNRNEKDSFDESDIRNYMRLDIPNVYNKMVKFLELEPRAFVEFVLNHFKANAPKPNRYGYSIAQKYALNRINFIERYLNESSESYADNQKRIKKLADKLSVELKDFKELYLKRVGEAAEKRYNNIPLNIEAYNNEIKALEVRYDEAKKEKKGYNYTWSIFNKKDKVRNKIERLKTILRLYSTVEDFKNFSVEEARKQFEYDVLAVSDRLLDKGFVTEKIKISNVKSDPKFFDMLISDGNMKLHCRSILAAEYSEKMIPHFRFIMT